MSVTLITNNTINFKRRENKFDPKVMAMALLVSGMTPSCTNNHKLQNDVFEQKVETYRTLDKIGRDKKEIQSIIWHLKSALAVDSAKVEILKDNKFRVKSSYLNKDVELTININKKEENSVYGVYTIKRKNTDMPEIYPYKAVYDNNIKDIKVSYKTVEGIPLQRCTLHRNDNGKLFIIKEDGDIEQIKQ